MENWELIDNVYLGIAMIVFAFCLIVLHVGSFEFEEGDDE